MTKTVLAEIIADNTGLPKAQTDKALSALQQQLIAKGKTLRAVHFLPRRRRQHQLPKTRQDRAASKVCTCSGLCMRQMMHFKFKSASFLCLYDGLIYESN
jgi:nucleoid DNA-binding protein